MGSSLPTCQPHLGGKKTIGTHPRQLSPVVSERCTLKKRDRFHRWIGWRSNSSRGFSVWSRLGNHHLDSPCWRFRGIFWDRFDFLKAGIISTWKKTIIKNPIFRGGGFNFLIFTPIWGRWFNLTKIFQMGWNHQLVFYVIEIIQGLLVEGCDCWFVCIVALEFKGKLRHQEHLWLCSFVRF